MLLGGKIPVVVRPVHDKDLARPYDMYPIPFLETCYCPSHVHPYGFHRPKSSDLKVIETVEITVCRKLLHSVD